MLARPATDFLDSFGANVHAYYNNGVYHPDAARVGRLLSTLGVRHVRDGHQARRQDALDAWNLWYYAHGVRVTLIEDYRADGTLDERAAEWPRIRGIAALEGPNEINQSEPFAEPPAPAPAWVQKTVNHMTALKALQRAKLPGVPVIGPAFTNWQAYEYYKQAGGAAFEDAANLHPYPGGKPPPGDLDWAIQQEVQRLHGGAFPFQITETGYHTAWRATAGHVGVTDEVQGAYIIPLLLESWLRGSRRTFLYELIDEGDNISKGAPESNFGLARWRTWNSNGDFALKPAGQAIANLARLLAGPPAASDEPDITITGTGVRSALLRRGDNKHVLLLWRLTSLWDVTTRKATVPPAPVSATITAPGITEFATHLIRESPTPRATKTTAGVLTVLVPADDVAAITF